jgi:predicted extracellular nuclease
MMKNILLFYTCFLALSGLHAQTVSVVFYNTENLFDTIDQSGTYDEEYTPFGKHEHSGERYAMKIEHLSKVINAADEANCPSLIGLCEVENETVVNDLKQALNCADQYEVLHVESPDMRGIDNALLVDAGLFEINDFGLAPIALGEGERPTRGVLWAQLSHKETGEDFLVYVNHWPSRYGGKELSAPKRMLASNTQTTLIKTHREANPKANVIVMGDLNDHPQDESVQALADCDTGACLENLMEHVQVEGRGTHAYRGDWGVLDHILVSRNMMNAEKGWSAESDSAEPVAFDWMMYEDEKTGALFPSRFYGSNAFYGGYSDHLPVRVVLNYFK